MRVSREELSKSDPIKNKDKKVFFVSLVASERVKGIHYKGFPTKEHFLFDVASELELSGYGVIFMSCQDLEQYYHDQEGKGSTSLPIYDLVQYLIQNNHGSSFFLDEVPFFPRWTSKYPVIYF